jgi:hypothetical protein
MNKSTAQITNQHILRRFFALFHFLIHLHLALERYVLIQNMNANFYRKNDWFRAKFPSHVFLIGGM